MKNTNHPACRSSQPAEAMLQHCGQAACAGRQSLNPMRHSCSHLLAMAVLKFFPKAKLAIGPTIENGFYYDFDLPVKISEKDLPKIEKQMKALQKKGFDFIKKEVSSSKAKKIFKNQIYKLELIKELKNNVSIYQSANFIDLCKGPHIKNVKQIGPFKLLSIAGAYWRGDEKNKMLTRIYGTCFNSQKELDHYLWQQKEAKKRDHRLLGKKLELFMFDDEVGQGLPLWLPKGAFIRHKIMDFAFNTYLEHGYEPVCSPHIATNKLWEHSGHLDFYAELMYKDFGIEKEKYRLKPMNCPFHVKMYNYKPRSYKKLPIRWTEMGTVYRYEKSGVLHGLTRVRGFTQDDAHIICTPKQLHQELVSALKLTLYILKTFGFKDFEMNLSVRGSQDKDKFIGNEKDWKRAEATLKKALAAVGYKKFVLDIGGAVFYGPKIDVKVADSLGRKWQLSTIQVDFNLPSRFKMKYIDKDGKEKVPFMIHRALLGSLERFIGVFIEHCAGAFPVWLSPVQTIIIPISEKQASYSKDISAKLKEKSLRVKIDARSETMQKKIKEAEEQKIPYMLIVGKREVKENKVSVRQRGEKNLGSMTLDKFTSRVKKEIHPAKRD